MTAPREFKWHESLGRRLKWITRGLFLTVAVLALQLLDLQIVHGPNYAEQATNNRLRSYWLRSQRGTVYGPDKSAVLAGNRAACDLFIVPKECEGREEEVCRTLQALIGVDAEALRKELAEYRRRPYTQIPVKRDIARTDLTRVEEMSYALPGVFPVVRPQRRYPYGTTGGQILGWINEIGEQELAVMPGYRMGDLMGRAGVEMAYESALKGRDGHVIVSAYNMGVPQWRTDPFGNPRVDQMWDQRGRAVTVEKRVEPVPGRPVFVTLDMDLQRKAEEVLLGAAHVGTAEVSRGAIVVVNARTGQVYALASVPGYDPNLFVDAAGGLRGPDGLSARERLLKDVDGLKRMRHRAFQEHAPPGSVFKIVVAVGALEEGVIDKNTTFHCPGHFYLGTSRWGCWRHGGHGRISIVDALAYSCDVFFYNAGLLLGADGIKKWATRLGLGEVTGIDLPGEEPGLVPSPEWKEQAHSDAPPWERAWQKGETVNLAIGQGQCVVTPLQTAVMMATIANGGYRVRPYLNLERSPELEGPLISQETLAIIRAGLRKCVTKHDFPSGTGRLADIEGLHVLGKTGTAQVVQMSLYAGMEEEDIPYPWRAHAWFVAAALDREPSIVVAVLFEHGLHGSTGAGPLAREIIEYFYDRRADDLVRTARREESP